MMRHKKKKAKKTKIHDGPVAMKLEGDMRSELTYFVRRGSMKLNKPPLQGVGARFRGNETKELAFGGASADDLDDTIPPNLERESSLVDLINDSAAKGREQRRMLFEKEEEVRVLKDRSVKDQVMQVLHHSYEYPRAVIKSVSVAAKTHFTRASNAIEDSVQQLTSTSGSAVRIGDEKRLNAFFAKLPIERIKLLCNKKDGDGKRPLHWAAGSHTFSCSSLFIQEHTFSLLEVVHHQFIPINTHTSSYDRGRFGRGC